MKWFVGILIFIFAGWKATTFLIDKNMATAKLITTDSLQAKASLTHDSIKVGHRELDTIKKNAVVLPAGSIDTKSATPQQIVSYAKTLMGTPYLYGSTDPAKGFDCSGFITHVFKQFDIAVPRSSIDFTHVGKEVSAAAAREGDLILFTGTDSADKFVGHMGIVVSNTDTLRFIHSTSGKQHGVTITPLSKYYQGRYVKTVRVFPE